jgi:hypothetical protein
MRSDDCSSNNDRQGISEVHHRPRQSCAVPTLHHHCRERNDSQRPPEKTEGHRRNHFPSPGHESNDETNEYECDEVSDVNPGGGEENIRAEVMLVNLVSLEHRKYRGLDPSRHELPQKDSSRNGCRRQPWSGAEGQSRKLEDGLQRLSPIPSAGERNSGF